MHAAMRRDCLDYNSYVSVCENGIWRIKKIGDYIENLKPSEKLDGFGTLGKKIEGVGVWSNPGKTEITEITKHTPTSMLRIFLEDGREIKVTENHRLYIKGKKEKRARDLRLGDKLIAGYKREIEERDIEELYLPEIFLGREDIMIKNIRSYLERFEKLTKHDNFVFRDSFPITLVEEILRRHGKTLGDLPSSARIAIKRDNISLPLRVNIDNVFLEVVGLYIAEGYLRKKDGEKGFYQISIAGNGEIKDFVKRVFDSHFGLKPTHENDAQVVFSSRIIYELFGEYLKCGHGAKEKRIPYMFLNLKKEKIAALLRGYFEGDGSVSLSDIRVACDSVSEGLKYDLSFLLSRFGILTKFYEYEKEPGPKVKQFYLGKKRAIPKFRITKIVILSDFVKRFKEIGFLSERKNKILDELCKKNPYGTKIEHDDNYAYPKIVKIEEIGQKESYCFNVKDEHNFFANDILLHNCDGDESAVMLLMDMLINFSRHFLPAHRGGTQDAPLVLNARMKAGEVDDMVFDIDVSREIPLELYEAAERGKSPYEIKMENVKSRLGGDKEFKDIWFSYDTEDINLGPVCSSYKTLPTMGEKVSEQMELCRKIRAVNTSDVARLIIERHFIRDTRGNLRKFSMQGFRCVNCNEKYRRPPLVGKCEKCGGRLIFTISEGSILKYMQPALELARKFEVSPYLLESLELTEMYIQSIFGKEKEIQENISKWF
jgi:DNA polymerase II large subunit